MIRSATLVLLVILVSLQAMVPCAIRLEGTDGSAFSKSSPSFLSFLAIVAEASASESEKSDESKDSLEKDVYFSHHTNHLQLSHCSTNNLPNEVVQHNLLQYPTLDIQVPPPKIG